ncbi:hypothetical protein M405DRAFT_516338 [Rhizopogon salebrosus TDB-379]|nr:hypothetical protein M405DRAFT_516338 [Rhizopogon salebrosus TDB-379]
MVSQSGPCVVQGNGRGAVDNFFARNTQSHQEIPTTKARQKVNDFWGNGTSHTPHRSAHLTSTTSRPRNFPHFLRVTPRLVDAFTMPLQLRRRNFNPFAGKDSVCTGDVAPARDEDRYGIAPPSAAEVAAAMQEVCDSSAQQGQAAAEAPQVSIQRPPTQVIPGKSSALGTEELSYMTGCCGFHLFRRRSTSHQ